MATPDFGYCKTPLCILKFVQLVLSFLVVGLIAKEYHFSQLYIFIMFTACLAITYNIILHVVYLYSINRKSTHVPWNEIEVFFNMILSIFYFLGFICGAMDAATVATQNSDRLITHSSMVDNPTWLYSHPKTWRNMVAVTSVFCIINSVLHGLAFLLILLQIVGVTRAGKPEADQNRSTGPTTVESTPVSTIPIAYSS